MKKIMYVAVREFLATVATKGFIIGILFTPLIMAIMIFVFPRLLKNAPPKVEGEVAIVDPTGVVAEGVRTTLAACALADRAAIEMPIARQMQAVLYEGKPPRDAVEELMLRTFKRE